MKTSIQQNSASPTPEQIASVASSLWDQAGRPSGRDTEFWTKAESQLRTSPKAAAASVPSTKPVGAIKWKSTAQFKDANADQMAGLTVYPIPTRAKRAVPTPATQSN